MEDLIVEVQEDHLRSLTSASPITALEELIYNALDADATLIDIIFESNEIDGVKRILVKDNGFGIHKDKKKYFKGLGGSWKKDARHTEHYKRIVHGQSGKGRFKAFALGDIVTWKTCYRDNGNYYTWEIIGNSSKNIRIFQATQVNTTKEHHGTTVIIDNPTNKARNINSKQATQDLTSELALYLTNYSNITITYDGKVITSQNYIAGQKGYKVPLSAYGIDFVCDITILEWHIDVEKAMYLCDESGFVLDRREMRIATSGLNISVYIKSEYFKECDTTNRLAVGELDLKFKKMIEAGKSCARAYCREKTVKEGQKIIETWKKDKVYPYHEPALNDVELVERQVFDVIALNIHEHLPNFEEFDNTAKKLSLSLVREALENNPS